jgi:hypothetical protein
MKKYFKCTVDILVEIDEKESNSTVYDLISEALTHNLMENKVINDWHYTKEDIGYIQPIEMSKEEAQKEFHEFQE